MTRRWKHHLSRPLLAITATAVTVCILEATVRFTGMAPEVISIEVTSDEGMCQRSDNYFLSFEMKPNYRNEQADCQADFPLVNSHGLRDTERTLEKPPGVRRVVLLGDSVVVGFGIRKIGDLMSQQLERLFPFGNVQVLNVAVIGYCTRAEVELLKVKGLQYDPDEVILVFVENDFDNFNRQARGIGGVAERPAAVDALFKNSQLFRMASVRLNWYGYGVESDPLHWNHRAVGDNNVVDGFKVLKDLSIQHDFRVTVAIWPTFDNDAITDKEKMRMGDRSDDLIVERLAREYDFGVCRMSQHFQEHWQATAREKNPRLLYTMGDEMHPSVEGHRVAAMILKDVLAGKRLRGPPSRDNRGDEFHVAIDTAKRLGDEEPNYAIDGMERAKRLVEEGKPDEALAAYRQVMEINPKFAVNAHTEMGLIMTNRGELDKAIEHFHAALKEKHDFHIAHTNLANVLLSQNKVDAAIRHYREAIRSRPEYGPAHNNLGMVLQSQGKLSEAIPHLRWAVQLLPGDPNIHRALGEALAKTDQLEQAIEQFFKGLMLQPDDAQLHFHLGRAYGSQGKMQKSLGHLRRSRQLAPQNASVHNSMGVTLMKLGRADEAIVEFAEALQLNPSLELAQRNLQRAQAARNQVFFP